MKIVCLIPRLLYGGGENVLVDLASRFSAEGHDVRLVAAARGMQAHGDLAKGVSVVQLDASKALGAAVRLARYLRRERPDAMLSTLHSGNVLAYLSSRLARFPGGCAFRTANYGERLIGRDHWAAGWIDRLEGAAYRYPGRVVVLSSEIADEVRGRWGVDPRRLRMIVNPLDLVRIRERASASPDPDLAELVQARPLFVSVGRLSAQKNFDTLIRAFGRARLPTGSRLVILGEGDDRLSLEALVPQLGLEGRVVFAGFRRNPFPIMAAGIYVQTSRFEGCPNALLQAAVLGRPTVWPDCPGAHRALFREDGFGWPVDPNSVEAVAAAMESAASSLGSEAHGSYRSERHELNRIAISYLEVLREAQWFRRHGPTANGVPGTRRA